MLLACFNFGTKSNYPTTLSQMPFSLMLKNYWSLLRKAKIEKLQSVCLCFCPCITFHSPIFTLCLFLSQTSVFVYLFCLILSIFVSFRLTKFFRLINTSLPKPPPIFSPACRPARLPAYFFYVRQTD